MAALTRSAVTDTARSATTDAPNIGAPRSFSYDVAVLGLGYVGLPTALAFHSAGHRVLGIDVDAGRLRKIASGRVDLLPADLDRLAIALRDTEAFAFTDDSSRVANARSVLICVPTPVDPQLVPDLTILRRACGAVVAHTVSGQVLILTSTSYVGSTCELLAQPLAARGLRPGKDVFVAFSPERIDPGNARPQQLVPRVVGGVTPACTARAMAELEGAGAKLYDVSSASTAEMTKLLENTFRAVNIAFVNEIAEASRALGLDVMEVIDAASTKPFGFMRFVPGPGVGGHCIPCDPHYLLWQLRSERLQVPVIEQAMSAIAARPRHVVQRAREVLSDAGFGLRGARVLVVGVTYKPDVEDLRESPALEIIDGLLRTGANVTYYDPLVPQINVRGTALPSLADLQESQADLVIVHTLHRDLDRDWLEQHPLVLDTTYRLNPRLGRVSL